jgi:hypothetical protein
VPKAHFRERTLRVVLGPKERSEDDAQRTAKLAGLTSFRLARYKTSKGLPAELLKSQSPVGLTSRAQALL